MPREIGTAYFREAAELTMLRCHRLPDPRRYFLDRLEARCRAYWRAVMDLEGSLEDAPDEDAAPPER